MTCDSVSKLIPLYFYGELTPDEEDRLEQHLHECSACASDMERQRTLAGALDQREVEIPPLLLEECRMDLTAAIQGGAPWIRSQRPRGPWTLFLEAIGESLVGWKRWQQPVGAVALVALGFVAARFSTNSPGTSQAGLTSPNDEVFATVRSIHPDSSGHVQIAFDETRRRTISGPMDDQNIKKLLLAGTREENPAVRVESMGLLKDHPASTDVKDVLLSALMTDSNLGVRLEALKGLRPVVNDPEVRNGLFQVLKSDPADAVRMQVVDLLVSQRDDSVVRVLQDAVQKEDNNYIRLKLEKALKDMNASVGIY